MKKRILATLMAICLLAGWVPTAALAAEDKMPDSGIPIVCTMDENCNAETRDEGCPLYVTPEEPVDDAEEPPAEGAESPAPAGPAVTALQKRINALPGVAELAEVDEDEQAAVYEEVCAIYGAIAPLDAAQVEALDMATLETAAAFLTQQIMPLADETGNSPDKQWKDTVTVVPDGYSANDTEKTVSISSAEGMAWFAKQIEADTTYTGYTITLENDIDLGSHDWISWDNKGTFSGCFDGNGHTIRNLYITGSSHGQGLFPVIKNGGVIKNLHVEDAQITSSVATMDMSGIIAFKLEDGTITSCHVSNSSITQRSGAGMIVGATVANTGGVISYCSVNNCKLTLSASSDIRGGGIAGELRAGNIYSNCLADGLSVSLSLTATNKQLNVGGIAGFNLGGTVEQCCVRNISVTYSGESPALNIGTVVGSFNSGSVSMCYAEQDDTFSCTGTNSSNADVTEIAEEQFSEKGSFPYLDFDKVWKIDPQSGLRLQEKTVFPALYYAEKLKITYGDNDKTIGGYTGTGGAIPVRVSVDVPLDCVSVTIDASASSGASLHGVPETITFPESTETAVMSHTFKVEYEGETGKEITIILTRPQKLAGSGTEQEPLIVSCLEDLKNLSKNITQRNIEGAYVSIASDIACGGAAIQPVSSVKSVAGNGHTISNFTINDTYTAATGLLKTLTSGGKISDLYIDSATMSGGQGSGILVGTIETDAEVENCAVTSSSFTGNINHYSGLLFGTNKGIVSSCYCEGDTRNAASNILSGAIGGKNEGTVRSCYSNVFVTGNMSGTDKGAFVWSNSNGKITDCFWNAERIKNCFSAGPASHSTHVGTVTTSAGVKFSAEGALQFGDTAQVKITYSAEKNTYYPTALAGFGFVGDSCASVSETGNGVSITGQKVGTSTISVSVTNNGKSWPFQTFEVEVSTKIVAVTMAEKTEAYDGTAKTIDATAGDNNTLPEGLTLVYSYKASSAEDNAYTHIAPTAPGTYTVRVESGNPNYTLTGTTTATLTISEPSATDKSGETTVTAPDSLIYDGKAKEYDAACNGIKSWTYTYCNEDGTKLDSAPANAGKYNVTITGRENDAYAVKTMDFEITKAKLTVKADDQTIYVGGTPAAYTYTVSGWRGSDGANAAALLIGVSVSCPTADAGKVGDYSVTVTGPASIDNYMITYENGILTVRTRSGGGGSGSSISGNTTTETITNKDGSTTTTVINKTTGTVTETTKYTDGSTLVVETKKDGTVTTTSTAANGIEVKTVDAPGEDVTASVAIPKSVGTATVTIPADVDYGTVAMDAKTGEIVKLSFPTEGGLAVKLDSSADLILVDNAKDFADTSGHWAQDGIDFATAHELFSGTSATTFAPDSPMTRAMLMTVLARFDGQNTTGGSVWYEKGMEWAKENGVSDGTDPDGSITREQLATMLWRYAGSPAAEAGFLSRFADAASVSGYAADAMRWAVSTGLIGGMGDGTLAPRGNATRAQVATILMRFVKNLTK